LLSTPALNTSINMRKIISITLLAITVILSSCTNPEVEEMVTIIDSSYTSIQKAEAALMAIDSAKIGNMVRYNDNSLSYIQDHFKDTATKEEGIFMSDIIAVKRSFSKLSRQQESLIDDMIYAKAQLNDLKKDVEGGLVTRQEFDVYFDTEKQAIDLFISTVTSTVSWNESNTRRFETMKPQIEKFIEEINKSES
jgi:hypothetical protein